MVGIGQVGVGYWGWNLLRNFNQVPNARVVGVCDQKPDVLDRVRSQFPDIPVSGSYRQLLERPDVDAVVIASETPHHFEMAKAALERDKHVFVEKPMTQSLEEAEQLLAISEANGKQIMVGHLLLYHPAYRYVENLVDDGSLGEIYYLYSVRVNLGIVRSHENALESLAPHDIAVSLAMAKRRPVAVSATGSAYLQEKIQDVAFATIQFDGGVLAHLHCSWLDPNKVRRLTVVGSKKMAVIDDQESREKVRLYDRDMTIKSAGEGYSDFAGSISVQSGDIFVPKIDKVEPLRVECLHFVECIESGTRPRTDARNGVEVMKVLTAARESLANGGAAIEL